MEAPWKTQFNAELNILKTKISMKTMSVVESTINYNNKSNS